MASSVYITCKVAYFIVLQIIACVLVFSFIPKNRVVTSPKSVLLTSTEEDSLVLLGAGKTRLFKPKIVYEKTTSRPIPSLVNMKAPLKQEPIREKPKLFQRPTEPIIKNEETKVKIDVIQSIDEKTTETPTQTIQMKKDMKPTASEASKPSSEEEELGWSPAKEKPTERIEVPERKKTSHTHQSPKALPDSVIVNPISTSDPFPYSANLDRVKYEKRLSVFIRFEKIRVPQSIISKPIPSDVKYAKWKNMMTQKKFFNADKKGDLTMPDLELHYDGSSRIQLPNYSVLELEMNKVLGVPYSHKKLPLSVYPNIPLNFVFRLESAPETCKKQPDIVVLVLSHPTHFAVRNAIRLALGKYPDYFGKKVGLVFSVGQSKKDKVNYEVKLEGEEKKDILQTDYFSSAMNSTLAVYHSFAWIHQNCQSALLVVKAVDSTYLNMGKIVSFYNSLPPTKQNHLYFGNCISTWNFNRNPTDSHFIAKEVCDDEIRWPMCSGSAILLSYKLMAPIVLAFNHFPWISGYADLEIGKAIAMYGIAPTQMHKQLFSSLHYNLIPAADRNKYYSYGKMTAADFIDLANRPLL